MRNIRFGTWALLLSLGVAAAVSGVIAQSRAEPRAERARPRVMMLDGRGGQIGVVVQDLDAEGLKAAGGAAGGVRIDDVDEDGPAAKAGLRSGDIVVEVDGDRVRSARQFSRVIQETADGRSVRLGIVRDGKRQTLEVTPESSAFAFGFDADRIGRDVARSMRELEPRLREIEPRLRELEPRLREFRFDGPLDFDWRGFPRSTSPRGRLGIQIGDLSPQLAEYFGAASGGVLVSSVTSESAAARAGIRAGDVITSIDGAVVRDADDLVDALRRIDDGEVTIGIVRDKQSMTVKAQIEERPERRVPAVQPI